MTKKIEQTTEYYLEETAKKIIKEIIKDFRQKIEIYTFTADDDIASPKKISYPAVQVSAEPYEEYTPGAGFGTSALTVMVRTHIVADATGKLMDSIFANVVMALGTSDFQAKQNAEKINVVGVTKISQSGINIDNESMTREKQMTFTVSMTSIQPV